MNDKTKREPSGVCEMEDSMGCSGDKAELFNVIIKSKEITGWSVSWLTLALN